MVRSFAIGAFACAAACLSLSVDVRPVTGQEGTEKKSAAEKGSEKEVGKAADKQEAEKQEPEKQEPEKKDATENKESSEKTDKKASDKKTAEKEKPVANVWGHIEIKGAYPESTSLPGLFGELSESLHDALARGPPRIQRHPELVGVGLQRLHLPGAHFVGHRAADGRHVVVHGGDG